MSIQEVIIQKNAMTNQLQTEIDSSRKVMMYAIRDRLVQDQRFIDCDSDRKNETAKSVAWQLIEEASMTDFRHLLLDGVEKAAVLQNLLRMLFGFDAIEPLIHDPTVSEIMINGPNEIFFEKQGQVQQALTAGGDPLKFASDQALYHVIDKIVAPINRKVDQSTPIVDARLPNGSRVNIVLPPVSLIGPIVTIRKFPDDPFTMDDLVGFGALTQDVSDLLQVMVKSRCNIVVAGGTGSGKTTFLNALSSYIGAGERVITVEDSAELKIRQVKNLARMETRPPNVEGKGEIKIRDLVRSALRMRPDRIVVGEVRGGEALDMLQAMNTGHDGSLTTAHANSCRDTIHRLETMVLMAGYDLPLHAIRQQISSAVDFVVYLKKLHDGTRRLVAIEEVLELDQGEIQMKPLVSYSKEAGLHAVETSIENLSKIKDAGYEPDQVSQILRRMNHEYNQRIFKG